MDRLLTTPEAAAYLGMAPATLQNDRSSHGLGVPYVKLGQAVRYREADLIEWVEQRVVRPGPPQPHMHKAAHWNFRVVEFDGLDGERHRAIFEVHYDEEGRPRARSEGPASIAWAVSEGNESALLQLNRWRDAIGKPVLQDSLFAPAG